MFDRSIKSLSLEELLAERPSFLARALAFARRALMVLGGVALAAAGGTAAYYYLNGPSEEPALVAEAAPAPARIAALTEIPAPDVSQAGTFSPAPEAAPIMEARLPRPRPDEPVFTGSVGAAERGYHAPRGRYLDPCQAFRRLSAPFRLNVRCGDEVRYRRPRPRYYVVETPPPPPPAYAYEEPRAYHPPRW